MRRRPVCGSTEWELERWLTELVPHAEALGQRLAVVAGRQRHGQGQRGRIWQAPPGGVWVSAAFPWPALEGAHLGLAVSVGLARQMEALGLPVRIKWPNDLMLLGRKLAGLLPRVRLRGSTVRWAQVGVGLNGINRVPDGAISVGQALAPRSGHRPGWHPRALPRRLEQQVWNGLDWAMEHAAEAELVRRQAESRLWRPPDGLLLDNQIWQIAGLEADGRLRLQRGATLRWLSRCF